MKTAIFDKTISLEYPDDFYEMNEEEIKRFFGGDTLRFGVRNADKHVILSVSKTKKSFLNIFLTPKNILTGAESALRQNLKDYNCLEAFETKMLSKKGIGIHFTYSAIDKNVKQFCEMVVVKYKSCFYITYCLARFEDKLENEKVFESFIDSLSAIAK